LHHNYLKEGNSAGHCLPQVKIAHRAAADVQLQKVCLMRILDHHPNSPLDALNTAKNISSNSLINSRRWSHRNFLRNLPEITFPDFSGIISGQF
jgi:hypothetical protein